MFGYLQDDGDPLVGAHPEFGQALQAGNDVFNRRVERALAERATASYADQFKWRATTNQERKQGKPEYVLAPTERKYYLPPDVTAAIYWSKNRMPDKWRDVQNIRCLFIQVPEEWLVDICNDISGAAT